MNNALLTRYAHDSLPYAAVSGQQSSQLRLGDVQNARANDT